MGHHIDLGRDRVAAPHDDQVGAGDLARVDAALRANPGEPACIGQEIADRQQLARITHRMAQPVDAVALHPPHRAGVVIRPDRLRAVALRRLGEALGDLVERVVPRDRGEGVAPPALVADPAQRHRQPVGVMLALRIAGDLGAHHPLRVGLPLSAAHPADAHPPGFRRGRLDELDRQRAGARAVVRADGVDGVERQNGAPGRGPA
jgi:hypothetical protein